MGERKKELYMVGGRKRAVGNSLPMGVDVKGDIVHEDKGWALSSQSSPRVLGCRS